jgi:hypothetical protein
MVASTTTKYKFRIRTRDGVELASVSVHGRDRDHAEKKLRQMYPHCEIVSGETCALSAPTQRLFELYQFTNRGLPA